MNPSVAAPRRRRTAWATGLLFALTLSFTVLGAASAFAVTRADVLARGQVWIDRRVPYSQTHYYGGYRTDCSGFASMCWRTVNSHRNPVSWNTLTFHSVTSTITVDRLLPGDGLLKSKGDGRHIRIFYGWVDDAHTMYVAYEQTGPVSKSSIKLIASDLASGYQAVRYHHIQASPPSPNLLRNPSFDVWAVSRTSWRDGPVWWTLTGTHDTTLTAHATGPVKATRSAVRLLNSNASKAAMTAISQTVTVTAETSYAVSVWARSACASSGVELRLEYLSALGASLLSTHIGGEGAGLDDTAFREMSIYTVAPANAVTARVTVRLAGGMTALSATETVTGTSALLDEISLARPQAAMSITRSAAHSHVRGKVTLSGAVTPAAAVGRAYTLWVQRPGSKLWTVFHRHTVYGAGEAAAWKCVYSFPKSARKGVYRFRAELPAFSWWLGAGTGTVAVTLK